MPTKQLHHQVRNEKLASGSRFSLCSVQAGVCRPRRRLAEVFLVKRRWCPRALSPAYTNKVCEMAICEANACRQRLHNMFEGSWQRTPLTQIGMCWLGRRALWCWSMASTVSIWRSTSVSSSRAHGQCLMRTMIECFTTQDHHVTVDTIQARLATMAKPELYRFSAVGGPRNTEDCPGMSFCLPGNAAEVETALNDGASRPGIDRFVFFFFCTRVEVEKKTQPATATQHHDPPPSST